MPIAPTSLNVAPILVSLVMLYEVLVCSKSSVVAIVSLVVWLTDVPEAMLKLPIL